MEKRMEKKGSRESLQKLKEKTRTNPYPRTAKEKGDWGEQIALNHYLKKGFVLVQKNFHGPRGEIDFILEKDRGIYFVEVKSRSSDRWGRPAEACDFRKRRHLIHTARFFLSLFPQNDWDRYSFEIFEVDLGKLTFHRIEQAFSLEEGF